MNSPTEQFNHDIAQHIVSQLHKDGLYGHWRCKNPNSSNCWFDIVTWPGSLLITGDMGEYLFQREDDMIAMMGNSMGKTSLDPSYWRKKCVAHGREEILVFSSELFQQELDHILSHPDDYWVPSGENLESIVESMRDSFMCEGSPQAAYQAMRDSGLWDENEYAIPDCEEFSFHFLWCLEAIKWFCVKLGQ